MPLEPGTLAVRGAVTGVVEDVLSASSLVSEGGTGVAAQDVVAIMRGMIDAAGERGEEDEADLIDRVGWAVMGYLGRADRG